MNSKSLNYINLPLNHLAKKKTLRGASLFFQIFNFWFKYDDENKLDELIKIFAILKDALLMQDDILDNSINRRSIPCSYRIYGIGQTFNSTVYWLLKSLSKIIEITDKDKLPIVLNVFIEGILDTIQGQSIESFYKDNLIVPTIDEAKEMCILKAASCLKPVTNILKALTGSDLNLDKVIDLLGLLMQMNNDLRSFTNKNYSDSKSFAEDISEGTFTIPIIHAINSNPDDTTVINILKLRTQDEDLKKIVIDYMEQSGSFEYARKLIEEVKLEFVEELKKFEENPFITAFINNNFNY